MSQPPTSNRYPNTQLYISLKRIITERGRQVSVFTSLVLVNEYHFYKNCVCQNEVVTQGRESATNIDEYCQFVGP
jgi:predicted house-cleaning NTP pyrophosphatase (Maf/HAM1 superfamily)